MIKCHLCSLETKQINGLMSRHWKSHGSECYTKEDYKRDLLISLGRHPKVCPVCSAETTIPKGEMEYPLYHRACYLSLLKTKSGSKNLNYKGGKLSVACARCGSTLNKHPSSFKNQLNTFCSTLCAMNFYAAPENRTDAQKESDDKGAEFFREVTKTDKFKKAHVKALAKMQTERKSSTETEVYNKVLKRYPDAVDQHVIDYYTTDIYVPSLDAVLEVNGNYWHNLPDVRSRDKRKAMFFKTRVKEYLTIWGHEIDLVADPIEWARQKPNIYVLCGASGTGKTWLASRLKDKYAVIDMDQLKYANTLEAALKVNKPTIITVNMQATRLMRDLASNSIRSAIAIIDEPNEVAAQRLLLRGGEFTEAVAKRCARYRTLKTRIAWFSGTQSEVESWFLSLT